MSILLPYNTIIRLSDCDPYGHLGTANYVRYLLEADRFAMNAIEAGVEQLEPLGLDWRLKNVYLEFLEPLTAGANLQILTRVDSPGERASRREYLLQADDAERPAARAAAEWYPAETGTLKTVPLPEEIASCLAENAILPADVVRFPPPPSIPPPPPGVFRMKGVVRWRDLDANYRLSYAGVADLLLDTSIQVGAAFGWSVETSRQHGIGYFARRLWLEYVGTARLEDELVVSTYVSQPKRSTIIRHYLVHRVSDQALIAKARILWVCVDANTGRPVRHLSEWMQGFEVQIAEEE